MRLTINGLKWNILLAESGSDLLIKDDTPCFGVTYHDQLTVYMDKNLPRELFHQILIHELTHVYLFSYGIHISDGDEREESVCDFTGSFLDSILRSVSAAEKSLLP